MSVAVEAARDDRVLGVHGVESLHEDVSCQHEYMDDGRTDPSERNMGMRSFVCVHCGARMMVLHG